MTGRRPVGGRRIIGGGAPRGAGPPPSLAWRGRALAASRALPGPGATGAGAIEAAATADPVAERPHLAALAWNPQPWSRRTLPPSARPLARPARS